MFGFINGTSGLTADMQAKLEALDRSQAVIEFKMDGTIVSANANFLNVMGYSANEVVGRHHSMFVDPAERETPAYRQFWEKLNRGEYQSAQFKRLGKGGKEIWIEASYNPILDKAGRPYKVVKYATDVTATKKQHTDLSQVNAINRSQAVIQFNLDGSIIDANENFLNAMGYRLDEIKGRHHSMFVDPKEVSGPDYKRFWEALNRGEYQAARYRRIGKGGKEIWIEASYNPVMDPSGRPYKVMKIATDVTQQVKLLDELKMIIDRNFGEIEQTLDVTEREGGSAAHAAQDAQSNVQTVAAAAEELAASAREISDSMTRSRQATESAFKEAETADQAARRLSEVASAMGGIVDLIRSIAGQINLLALNATIEAARAGEAGRGFAVVANEVKNLANQSANATAQISKEIEGMQAVSGDVVSSLGGIRNAMNGVREYVTVTAGAVEEQSSVTSDMSNSMQSASGSVSKVERGIGEMSAAVSQVAQAVMRTKEAARVLAR